MAHHNAHKPEGYQVFVVAWILYAIAVTVVCLRMIFVVGNDSWRQLSHRNGILWGLVVYLLLRALFYCLYLVDDERSMGDFIYYSLIDVPTIIFYFVYTQLVLFWATMADKNALEEHRWRRGYLGLMSALAVVLITNLIYRIKDGSDTMRYVYGLTLGTMTIGLAIAFLIYGWKFQVKFESLSEGDVRRRRLPRMLAAMALFSVGFVVYGIFLICGYALGLDYMPGIESGLDHGQESAVIFRLMDCFLATLICYIVQAPGNTAHWKKTFSEPFLESDPQFSEIAPYTPSNSSVPAGSMSGSLSTPMHSANSPMHAGRSISDEDISARVLETTERFAAYSQPMGLQPEESKGSSGRMTTTMDHGDTMSDFPYKDRVMKHYRSAYGHMNQPGYQPPSPQLSNSVGNQSAPAPHNALSGLPSLTE